MKCDICQNGIGDHGGDWVAVEGGEDICTPCAAREIAELRTRVRELEEHNQRLIVHIQNAKNVLDFSGAIRTYCEMMPGMPGGEKNVN